MLVILVADAATAALGAGASQAATVQSHQQTAFGVALQGSQPALVFVEAPWCPNCAKERPFSSSSTP